VAYSGWERWGAKKVRTVELGKGLKEGLFKSKKTIFERATKEVGVIAEELKGTRVGKNTLEI